MRKRGEWNTLPFFITSINSSVDSRSLRGSILISSYTAIRVRPLLRRRARTLRPAVVLERTRKPCDLARFRFFGLYVNDMHRTIYKKWNNFKLGPGSNAGVPNWPSVLSPPHYLPGYQRLIYF
jgi:hypothetical protein